MEQQLLFFCLYYQMDDRPEQGMVTIYGLPMD